MKYEVAEDLGLRDDIQKRGWGDMTARQCGTVGGHMVRQMIRFAESRMPDEGGGHGDGSGPS